MTICFLLNQLTEMVRVAYGHSAHISWTFVEGCRVVVADDFGEAVETAESLMGKS